MEESPVFYSFHYWFGIGEKVLLLLGIVIVLTYFLRLALIKKPKKRYDFINQNEIKAFRMGGLFIIIALVLLMDDLVSFQFEKYLTSEQFDIIEFSPLIGGFFVVFIFGVLFYSGLRSVLNIYYPNYLGKRLEVIRFKPRTSAKTGNKMRLLNEEEEDVHLTEAMQEDEESLKYDYDVWLDDETGDVQIEKYDMHTNAIICPECNYRTFKTIDEKLINTTKGEEVLMREFECSYCGHNESKNFKVSHLDELESEGSDH